MRSYYAEYAQHCMRFYSRHPTPTFRSDVDQLNWNACASALSDFTLSEQRLLISLYAMTGTLPDNVLRVAETSESTVDSLWRMVNQLEQKVAQRRYLI